MAVWTKLCMELVRDYVGDHLPGPALYRTIFLFHGTVPRQGSGMPDMGAKGRVRLTTRCGKGNT